LKNSESTLKSFLRVLMKAAITDCNGGVQSKMGCANATVPNLKPMMITW
jgi:hypothetical protein